MSENPSVAPKVLARRSSRMKALIELERSQIAFWKFVFVGALLVTLTAITVIPAAAAWISFSLAKESLNEKIADSAKLVEANTDNRLIAFRAAIDEAQRQLGQAERAADQLKVELQDRQQELSVVRSQMKAMETTQVNLIARVAEMALNSRASTLRRATDLLASYEHTVFWTALSSSDVAFARLAEIKIGESGIAMPADLGLPLTITVSGEHEVGWFKMSLFNAMRAASCFAALSNLERTTTQGSGGAKTQSFGYKPDEHNLRVIAQRLEALIRISKRHNALRAVLVASRSQKDLFVTKYSWNNDDSTFRSDPQQGTIRDVLDFLQSELSSPLKERFAAIQADLEGLVAPSP